MRHRLLVALVIEGRSGIEVDALRRAAASPELTRIPPHITLVPPVNVADAEIDAALGVVRAAASASAPVHIELGPAATFAPSHHVVYLAVAGQLDELEALRAGCDRPPLRPRAGGERRPYVAHVTLTNRADGASSAALTGLLGGFRLPATLETMTVFSRDAKASEHRWERVADVALGPVAIVGRGGRELTFVTSSRIDLLTAALVEIVEPQAPRRGEAFAMTAYLAGRAVAACSGVRAGPIASLTAFGVAPTNRREGIGTALLAMVEHHVTTLGAVEVWVEASGDLEAYFGGRGYRREPATGTLRRWLALSPARGDAADR